MSPAAAAFTGFDPYTGKMPASNPAITPKGRIFSATRGAEGLDCYVYVPEWRAARAIPIVCVHGISRNALEHAASFRACADAMGAPLIAPLFQRPAFRAYQTLGPRRTLSALVAFERLLQRLPALIGADTGRLNLFGFSGGAQFVHRFAMARPSRVGAIAVAAAGWYTMPDPSQRYPDGCGGMDGRFGDLDAFLSLPLRVFAGDRDTEQDGALRRSALIDARQGANRVERARAFTFAINSAAAERGMPAPASFEILPGAGHSFAECVNAGLARSALSFFQSVAAGDGAHGRGEAPCH